MMDSFGIMFDAAFGEWHFRMTNSGLVIVNVLSVVSQSGKVEIIFF